MENCNYTRIHIASGIVAPDEIELAGIVVNSHSSGVITLNDHASAASGETVLSSYALPTGSSVITFPKPIIFKLGIYLTLVSGSASLTFLTR